MHCNAFARLTLRSANQVPLVVILEAVSRQGHVLSVLQGAQERGEDGREELEDLVMLSVCCSEGLRS